MQQLPNYHKRAFAHNYHAPFIYHIILKKIPGAERFGEVKGDARIAPGNPGCAFIEETAIGKRIAGSIIELQKRFPILQIYQFKVMPDHVHILLRVKDWSERHLDFYIENLKGSIGRSIFEPGYCDKPLLRSRSLDSLFTYIRENPHRLAMRLQFPHFFTRTRMLKIGGGEYEAYGNLFLFRNPDKILVQISRRATPDEIAEIKEQVLMAVEKGTILVSPFISPAEKEVRVAAEEAGGKVILVVHEAFMERYRPAAHDFGLCCDGRLLIVSLGMPGSTVLERDTCLRMNALAREIAAI